MLVVSERETKEGPTLSRALVLLKQTYPATRLKSKLSQLFSKDFMDRFN